MTMPLLAMGKEVCILLSWLKSNIEWKSNWFLTTIAAADDEFGPDGKRIRPGITSAIITELTECNSMLSGQRKKRQVLSNFKLNIVFMNTDTQALFNL